ncbi:MAG: hypothetical protein J6Q68_02105, partial [Clostridia bacterium]|nr:hypothetical protein [Clostridia bacterium]
NKRTVEALIKCGVFDALGVHRSALIASYESIIDHEHNKSRNNISGQIDMFSLSIQDDEPSVQSFEYPEVPEYTLRELLMLEKECSGMYFSGHMIDNYSLHAESISPERISDILEEAENFEFSGEKKYQDKQNVKLVGIITAKKTKVIKNGETMAFITLEDRYGEIEVIVFSRQYKLFQKDIFVENAVAVEGSLSFEDGDEVRLLLSSLSPLSSNTDFDQEAAPKEKEKDVTVYVKVSSLSDAKIPTLTRMALLNPGKAKVVVFDCSTKRYSALTDAFIDPTEKVFARLKNVFGENNVVIK